MAVVEELIRIEENQTLSFGNYTLEEKAKKSDFEFKGDLYKVKTCKEITKLEKNGMFVYESVPGTTVTNFTAGDKVSFEVEGFEDAQVTLELEAETEYKITVNDNDIGEMKTNLGGKLMFSLELDEGAKTKVLIEKM